MGRGRRRNRQIIGKSRLNAADELMGAEWFREQSEKAVEEANLSANLDRENADSVVRRDRFLHSMGLMLLAGAAVLTVAIVLASIFSGAR